MRRTVMLSSILLSVLPVAACGTLRAYDGPALPPGEFATVIGDPVVSAGLPVKVIIRKANEREIRFGRRRVELPPGRHVFVVDCRVAEAGSSRRFMVEEELAAGMSYRFEADASSRGCDAVRLRQAD